MNRIKLAQEKIMNDLEMKFIDKRKREREGANFNIKNLKNS